LRALITTHFNRLAADFDFDGIRIELAVASRTSFLNHGIALQYPKSGWTTVGHTGRETRCQNL
jgi:hypothetical protein